MGEKPMLEGEAYVLCSLFFSYEMKVQRKSTHEKVSFDTVDQMDTIESLIQVDIGGHPPIPTGSS
jgi:hypothetical protein